MNFHSKTKLIDTSEDRDELISSIKTRNGLTRLSHRSSIRPSTSPKKVSSQGEKPTVRAR